MIKLNKTKIIQHVVSEVKKNAGNTEVPELWNWGMFVSTHKEYDTEECGN